MNENPQIFLEKRISSKITEKCAWVEVQSTGLAKIQVSEF